MPDDAARKREAQRLEKLRLAERGDYDADRGDYDADRGDYDADRGDYDADRGDYDADRGDYDADRGGAFGGRGAGPAGTNPAVADILRKAAGLGGHLIVALVAPVGTSMPRRRAGRRTCATGAHGADVQVAELIEQLRQKRALMADELRTTTQSSPAASADQSTPRRPTDQ
jgi:hypothetical protein